MHEDDALPEQPPTVTTDTLRFAINNRRRHVVRWGRYYGLQETSQHLNLIRNAARAEIEANGGDEQWHIPADLIPLPDQDRPRITDPAFTRLRQALTQAIDLQRFR